MSSMRSLLDLLVEDTEHDVRAYAEAKRIMSVVIRHFMDGDAKNSFGMRFKTMSNGLKFGALRGDEIGLSGREAKLWFLFGTRASRDGDALANYYREKASDISVIKVKVAVAPADQKSSEDVAKQIVHDSRLHMALYHELIHYLDNNRDPDLISRAGRRGVSDDDWNDHTYWNSPHEFNAFSNNFFQPLLSFIHMAQSARPNRVATIATAKGIDQDFGQTFRNLLGRCAHEPWGTHFLEMLNERNRRALMKRLYRLHKDAVALLERAAKPAVSPA